MKYRLIALDIDGVLNSEKFYKKLEKEENRKPNGYELDHEAVALLNDIIEKTSTKEIPTYILLTSTWRLDFRTAHGINLWFEAAGIKKVCIGRTDYYQTRRGWEIILWIAENQLIRGHEIEGFCIIDDDGDMEQLLPWHIWTPNKLGLMRDTADKAIEMLMKPFRFDLALGGFQKPL